MLNITLKSVLTPYMLKHSNRSVSTAKCCRAVCCPQSCYGPLEIQRSEMLNGIKIVAAKCSGALMAACTIMFEAGSRYETHDDLGASHFIRAASSGAGCEHSAFAKLRVLQQKGAYLTCTSDRQTVAFTLRCPLPYFPILKSYLVDAAVRCCYHEWEISDRKQLVKKDLVRIPPEQRVIDLVQKASWAGPLANSTFCEEERVDSMTSDTLRNYAVAYFRSNQCSVASVGIPFEETSKVAEMIDSKTERPTSDNRQMPSQTRSGIETYDLGANSDTWIAVAVRGCGTDHFDDLLKHAIVASACGSGNITQGQHEMDRTPQGTIGLIPGSDVFSYFRAFNISYVDCGLFGVVAKTKAANACKAASAASEILENVGKLSCKHIEDGKKRLQVGLALHNEDCVNASEGLALQALNDAQLDTTENVICMIDAIAPADITATANALSAKCNKMAVAIVGDVDAVPTDIFKYI